MSFCSQGGGGSAHPPPHRQTCRGWQTPLPDADPPIGRPGGVGQTPLDADPPCRQTWGSWADPPPMQTLLSRAPPPRDADPLPPDADPRPGRPPPPRGYVNKRAVRILLECILVKGVCFSHRDLFFAVLYSRVPGQWD